MSFELEKVQSVDCPHCGCNATKLIGAGENAGRPWARFECDFCNAQFALGRFPAENQVVNGVVYQPVRCPKCKCKDCPVTSSPTPIRDRILRKRYHKCKNCGQQFKSVEN